jgi:Rrf2 family protein
MAGVLRISEAASLALHTMALLASEREKPIRIHDMARTFGISEAHLAKVLQRLSHAGLVEGTRGPRGGFMLPEGGEKTTLLTIYETIEGRLEESACLLQKPVCGGSLCMMGNLIRDLNSKLRKELDRTRLCDISKTSEVFHRRYEYETQNSKN